MQRFSNVNSFVAHSSYAGMTELDRVDTSYYQSSIKFIKPDTKIASKVNFKFEINFEHIKQQLD